MPKVKYLILNLLYYTPFCILFAVHTHYLVTGGPLVIPLCVSIATRSRDVYFMVLVAPIIAPRTNHSETLIGKLTKIDIRF